MPVVKSSCHKFKSVQSILSAAMPDQFNLANKKVTLSMEFKFTKNKAFIGKGCKHEVELMGVTNDFNDSGTFVADELVKAINLTLQFRIIHAFRNDIDTESGRAPL